MFAVFKIGSTGSAVKAFFTALCRVAQKVTLNYYFFSTNRNIKNIIQ